MSQQINLYNPAFRKSRDWLTATPLLLTAGGVLLAILLLATWASWRAEGSERRAALQEAKLKTAQENLMTLSKAVAASQSNTTLATELARVQLALKRREQVMALLAEGGTIGNTTGFSEYLRGLARQLPSGLWLTGFTIGGDGDGMEIRGRMLNAATLPEYIRRLNSEKVFQGRSFSALTIQRPNEDKKPVAANDAQTGLSPYVEFVLTPSHVESGLPDTAGKQP
jgi:hypothetical protein